MRVLRVFLEQPRRHRHGDKLDGCLLRRDAYGIRLKSVLKTAQDLLASLGFLLLRVRVEAQMLGQRKAAEEQPREEDCPHGKHPDRFGPYGQHY